MLFVFVIEQSEHVASLGVVVIACAVVVAVGITRDLQQRLGLYLIKKA